MPAVRRKPLNFLQHSQDFATTSSSLRLRCPVALLPGVTRIWSRQGATMEEVQQFRNDTYRRFVNSAQSQSVALGLIQGSAASSALAAAHLALKSQLGKNRCRKNGPRRSDRRRPRPLSMWSGVVRILNPPAHVCSSYCSPVFCSALEPLGLTWLCV